jgi:hypothetical protein
MILPDLEANVSVLRTVDWIGHCEAKSAEISREMVDAELRMWGLPPQDADAYLGLCIAYAHKGVRRQFAERRQEIKNSGLAHGRRWLPIQLNALDADEADAMSMAESIIRRDFAAARAQEPENA